jgi:hypothetical protein
MTKIFVESYLSSKFVVATTLRWAMSPLRNMPNTMPTEVPQSSQSFEDWRQSVLFLWQLRQYRQRNHDLLRQQERIERDAHPPSLVSTTSGEHGLLDLVSTGQTGSFGGRVSACSSVPTSQNRNEVNDRQRQEPSTSTPPCRQSVTTPYNVAHDSHSRRLVKQKTKQSVTDSPRSNRRWNARPKRMGHTLATPTTVAPKHRLMISAPEGHDIS